MTAAPTERAAPPTGLVHGAEPVRPGTASQSTDVASVEVVGLTAWYGRFRAVRDVSLRVEPAAVLAIIGPSGCGKSTLLRVLNRMHELVPGGRVSGSVRLGGTDIYGRSISAMQARAAAGMVYQKPNPFPSMSVFENVAAGLRLAGMRNGSELDGRVEWALRRAALWEEVGHKLRSPGVALSGGQQQRLCIARTIAPSPAVILMDEPCSSLDPIATQRIEELIRELGAVYSIVIVTHNLGQAARVSQRTAFLCADDERCGYLVEEGPTEVMFTHPSQTLTEQYVSGRFG